MNLNIQSFCQPENQGVISRDRVGYDGHLITPDGIVLVTSQDHDNSRDSYSTYRAVYCGRFYYAYEQKSRTRLGLAIMAGKFMREVVAPFPTRTRGRDS